MAHRILTWEEHIKKISVILKNCSLRIKNTLKDKNNMKYSHVMVNM